MFVLSVLLQTDMYCVILADLYNVEGLLKLSGRLFLSLAFYRSAVESDSIADVSLKLLNPLTYSTGHS